MGNARKSIFITSIVALAVAAGCSRPLPPETPPAPPAPADTPELVIVENLPIEPDVTEAPDVQPEESPSDTPPSASEDSSAPDDTAETAAIAEDDEGSKDPFNSDSVDKNREGKYILKRSLMTPKRDP